MSYIIVKFPDTRGVVVDDEALGQNTGELIELEPGHHDVALEGENNFAPQTQEIVLENEGILDPLEVEFTKV